VGQGAAIVGLAILARLANRLGFSATPLYLAAGLAFGNGGLAPLDVSEDFIRVGAEIGVLLLLFMLGLEYTGEELKRNLRLGLPAGVLDFALNFPPGVITGLLLGWHPLAAVLLGGVTYISSSGIIAKVIGDLGRLNNAETPTVVSVLVVEDKSSCSRHLALCSWWRAWRSGCGYRPQSEHFSSASPCPVPLPNTRGGFWRRCVTCLPQPFSFSSGYRSTR
jgi:predicted Kef-type K+ transport protein